MFNEGIQIDNFILCQLLGFHFIAVPVSLRTLIKLRFRFRSAKSYSYYGSGSTTLGPNMLDLTVTFQLGNACKLSMDLKLY